MRTAEGTMIERVARAIEPMPWNEKLTCMWRDGAVAQRQAAAMAQARAAIEAIGEPTQAMIRAGARNLEGQFAEDRADQLWADMIEAALSDTKAPA